MSTSRGQSTTRRLFYNEGTTKTPVDLAEYEQSEQSRGFDVPASDLAALSTRFDPAYSEKLDPEKTESPVYAFGLSQEWLRRSADEIVLKALGALAERTLVGKKLVLLPARRGEMTSRMAVFRTGVR